MRARTVLTAASALVAERPRLRRWLQPLRPAFEVLSRRLGPSGPSLNARYDALTVEIIGRVLSDGDTGIDVGAHTGAILEEILARSPTGTHYAFEPLPHLHDALAEAHRERIEAGGLVLSDRALSDRPGTTTFQHNVTSPGYSGLRRRRYDRGDTDIRVITVERARLDDLVGREETVTFLKIDVEGGDYDVLVGGRELLARDRPTVVFEFGPGGADHYDVTPSMMHRLFDELAMDLYPLNPSIERPLDADGLQVQFDTANFYFCAVARGRPRPF